MISRLMTRQRVVPEQPAVVADVRHMIVRGLLIAEQEQIQRGAIDHLGADAVGVAESGRRLWVALCRFRFHGDGPHTGFRSMFCAPYR
jgi:hypothetical protein